jgi:EAL domain-containing protein (putative c-di-GMP-specific phosphodiesterase class I)
VQEIGHRQKNADIVGTIALLARILAMKVLAEGVETRQQLEILIRSGCDYAQGNLFSAAVDGLAAGGFFAGFRHVVSPPTPQIEERVAAAVGL